MRAGEGKTTDAAVAAGDTAAAETLSVAAEMLREALAC